MPYKKSSLLRNVLPKDPLFRLLVINATAGVAIAFLVLGGLLWSNIGNLWGLITGDDSPVLAIVMLAFALVITLGSVVIGSAIMLLDRGGTGGTGGSGRKSREPFVWSGPQVELVPVHVKADKRARG